MIERRASEGISLTTLARALGIHRATLAAAFRRYRGTSVGEMIREVRVRKVMRALLGGDRMPLCEIATSHGFHDQAHMGRVFRKVVGLAPGPTDKCGADKTTRIRDQKQPHWLQ